MATLILHPGKEKSVLRRHPWLFSGAVAQLDGRARPGDTVDVVSHEGRPLARAAWSPASQIRARVWSFDVAETIDHAFFKRRIAAAVARRAALPELAGQQGLRLIHAESDGLPGVIADRYGDTELAQDRRVLNCFCYTAGFSLQALAGGAREVVSMDSSAPALATAQRNLALNPQLDKSRALWREADVFAELRNLRASGENYDLIILDPPKFAHTAAHADRAGRAYKDINLGAMRLLAPGGLLMTYSCSGGVNAELFQKIVAGAALDVGRTARIVQRLQGAADHPVDLAFPEGEYLKGLLLQLD